MTAHSTLALYNTSCYYGMDVIRISDRGLPSCVFSELQLVGREAGQSTGLLSLVRGAPVGFQCGISTSAYWSAAGGARHR
jgi:hypothetical protein